MDTPQTNTLPENKFEGHGIEGQGAAPTKPDQPQFNVQDALRDALRAVTVLRQEVTELARRHGQLADAQHQLANQLANQVGTGAVASIAGNDAEIGGLLTHIHDWLTKHGMSVFPPPKEG